MRVNVGRCADIAVPESFVYVIDTVALCNHQRSAGMTQIMKTDIFETVLLEYFLGGSGSRRLPVQKTGGFLFSVLS